MSKSTKKSRATTLVSVLANVNWKKLIFPLGASALVIIFFWQYLSTGNNKTLGGDFDYSSQLYEAFRISVLKFHQFPLWNPWLSGGIPLYANPQFGLVSLQSLLVLPFGAIYGLKLAYICYALLGFWGMFCLGRQVLQASKVRSTLIAYIWVFSGFFAGHNISHFTFTSFFLLPWLVYFIAQREKRWSWLGLGLVESMIILSSIHYAFLMMTLMVGILSGFLLLDGRRNKTSWWLGLKVQRTDAFFAIKAIATTVILAGYQFITTYSFISHNQRLTSDAAEVAPTISLLFKALFVPVGTIIHHYPKTTWGWGEYSMYVGLGTGTALLVCLATIGYSLVRRSKVTLVTNRRLVLSIVALGLIASSLALGDFGPHSPFHLLHLLPGFTQTRVPSRWQIFTIFAILTFLLSWRRSPKVIDGLLALAVLELFIAYGPTHFRGAWFTLPSASFSAVPTEYDNGLHHIGVQGASSAMDSYYYTTSRNIGQVYADDSLIDTLSGFPPLPTSRCATNDSRSCAFVTTHNAQLTYWSPDKITLKRTGPGSIALDMNLQAGWQVNDSYPYYGLPDLQPIRPFILPAGQQTYTLRYAPKFSPSWVVWHIQHL